MFLLYRSFKNNQAKRQARVRPSASNSQPSPAILPSSQSPKPSDDDPRGESEQAIITQGAFEAARGNELPPADHRSFWAKYGRSIKLLVALLFPLLLETFDYTITASAQPHIASAFNRLDLQSWIGTAFVLTSTAFLMLFGNIADAFGRHTALQVALVVFLLGSAICTGAQSMPMLLAGRGIAGVGGAGITSVVRVIIADAKSLDDNNTQNAAMVALMGIGFAVGPVIGGALATVQWRWIFAINLPIVFVSAFLVFFLLRDLLVGPQARRSPDQSLDYSAQSSDIPTLREKFTRVDWIGGALFILSIILVLYGLSTGSSSRSIHGDTWSSAQTIVSLAVGGVVMILFFAWEYILEPSEERRAKSSPNQKRAQLTKHVHTDAMIPLAIFRSYDVCATCFSALAGGMVLFGCLYFLSIYFAVVAGYSATKSGTQLLYFAPGLGGGVWTSIALVKLTRQPKYPIILGSIIQPIAVGLLSKAIWEANNGQVNGFLALAGVGAGMTFGPISIQGQFVVAKKYKTVVVTLSLFFRIVGGTIGLAQLSAVLESQIRHHLNGLVSSGKVSSSDLTTLLAAIESLSADGGIPSLSPELRNYAIQSYQYGTRWAFISLIPWGGLAAISTFWLKNIVDRVGPDQENEGELKMEERKGDAHV